MTWFPGQRTCVAVAIEITRGVGGALLRTLIEVEAYTTSARGLLVSRTIDDKAWTLTHERTGFAVLDASTQSLELALAAGELFAAAAPAWDVLDPKIDTKVGHAIRDEVLEDPRWRMRAPSTRGERGRATLIAGLTAARGVIDHPEDEARRLRERVRELEGSDLVAGLTHQLRRLREHHGSPGMRHGFSPAEVLAAVRSECSEVEVEPERSDRARTECGGVIATAFSLAIAHGGDPAEVIAEEVERLATRLNCLDEGKTWDEAKAIEAAMTSLVLSDGGER